MPAPDRPPINQCGVRSLNRIIKGALPVTPTIVASASVDSCCHVSVGSRSVRRNVAAACACAPTRRQTSSINATGGSRSSVTSELNPAVRPEIPAARWVAHDRRSSVEPDVSRPRQGARSRRPVASPTSRWRRASGPVSASASIRARNPCRRSTSGRPEIISNRWRPGGAGERVPTALPSANSTPQAHDIRNRLGHQATVEQPGERREHDPGGVDGPHPQRAGRRRGDQPQEHRSQQSSGTQIVPRRFHRNVSRTDKRNDQGKRGIGQKVLPCRFGRPESRPDSVPVGRLIDASMVADNPTGRGRLGQLAQLRNQLTLACDQAAPGRRPA